jgi:signal transduction histidine kinase
VARGLVGVDVALARSLIGPRPDAERVAELTQRVETLHRTREMTVDSVELERRRIERDLHDGPQQRLVALAMDLGMAQTKLDDDPEAARALLAKAHSAAKEAIVEMRQVARGIHPPVLTDRGLDAALSALAARAPVPVQIRVDLPRRPSPTIESIAYFCVSEALTNIAKHSGAAHATVDVTGSAEGVHVVVTDDGRGGADPTGGTGLSGLRQRLAAVDGTLTIDSPPGAGTRLMMTLPDRTAADAARTTSPPAPAGPASPPPTRSLT